MIHFLKDSYNEDYVCEDLRFYSIVVCTLTIDRKIER
jgi:hypothetical protein